MSLATMAVRLAARAALAPYFADGVTPSWPTVADGRIFDSRFDLLDGRGGERTPLIVFAVEAIDGMAFSEQLGAQSRSRGFNISARLVLSAQVTSRQTFRDSETNETFDAEAADLLDAELADMLDLLQDQAWAVLDGDSLFRKVVKRITKLDAEPYPSSETGEKLAVLANSYFVEPLEDGEKALGLVRDLLPAASPVRARAALALDRIAATRAVLAAARLARSFPAAPFAVDGVAQGANPSLAEPVPPPETAPDIHLTLDPEDTVP